MMIQAYNVLCLCQVERNVPLGEKSISRTSFKARSWTTCRDWASITLTRSGISSGRTAAYYQPYAPQAGAAAGLGIGLMITFAIGASGERCTIVKRT